MTRIVRTRSILNVSDERLVGDLETLHGMIHTAEGLHAYDDTRRRLINNGIKLRRIVHELTRRGHPLPACHTCRPTGSETYLT